MWPPESRVNAVGEVPAWSVLPLPWNRGGLLIILRWHPVPFPALLSAPSPHFCRMHSPGYAHRTVSPSVPGDAPGFALSHGKHHSWGPASCSTAPGLWGQPGCPGSAHHPLCHPNTQSLCPASDNSCPLSLPSGFAQYRTGNTGSVSARLGPGSLQ